MLSSAVGAVPAWQSTVASQVSAIAEGSVIAQLSQWQASQVSGRRRRRYRTGDVDDDVVHFITAVVGAPNAVVGRRRRAGLAVQGGVAGLRAIAEGAVVAQAVVHGIDDDVVHFITAVVGAPNAVVGRRRRAGLAVQGGVAGLRAVAEGAVIAVGRGSRH